MQTTRSCWPPTSPCWWCVRAMPGSTIWSFLLILCMYFCGRMGQVKYPAPVQLEGEDLPWVEQADHLGHVLHQSVTMDKDCTRARASFIDRSVDVRQQFSFASPDLTLQMVQVLCSDGYGSMLWNLQSDSAESYFKSWNTCVKLVHGVPRSTFTYLVEGFWPRITLA